MEGRHDEAVAAVELLEARTPVGVLAEAGMGTTTLLDQITVRFAGSVRGGALRTLSSTPLLPLSRALGDDVARHRDRLATLLEQKVGQGLLVLDDLQWADPQTFAALRTVGVTVRLLVGIRKGDADEADARRALAAAGGVLVPLGPLDDPTMGSIVRRLRPDVSPPDLARLIRDAGGNPGVLHQLVQLGTVGGTLAEALSERVRRCDPAALGSLALLAANVDPLPVDVLGDRVDELAEAGLVTVVSGSVMLRHAFTGDAAQAALEPEDRAGVHRQLAALNEDPARCAMHLHAAGDTSTALPLALAAAELADRARRPGLLELAADCTHGAERARLLTAAAEAALAARDRTAARRLAEAALVVPGTAPSAGTLAVAAEARARDGSAGSALDAASLVPDSAEAEHRTRAMAASSLALAWPLWRPTDALERATAAAAVDAAHPSARAALGVARLVAGDEAWRDTSDSLGPTTLTFGSMLDGHADASLVLHTSASLVVSTIAAFHLTGDCDGVGPRLQRVVDETERATDLELARAHLSLSLTDSGRSSAAAEVALAALRSEPSPAGHALLSWALVEAETTAGRLTRARKAFEQMDHEIASPALTLAAVAASWAAFWSPSRSGSLPAPSASPWTGLRAAEAEHRGIALLIDDRGAEADAAFTEAALGWSRWHRRGELRCRWAAADAALSGPEPASAVERLREVELAATRLGQRPLVARVRASLRGAGVRTQPSRGQGRGPLSAREVEVLELVRLGFTSGEAAHSLGVASSTVDTQVESAMRKLGARTRLHAAALVGELAP